MKRFTLIICLLQFVPLLNAQFVITSQSVKCYGGNDGSAQITPSTGYLYHWSNGDSLAYASTLSAGGYTCTVSNLQGLAIDTLRTIIYQPNQLIQGHTTAYASCEASGDGSIRISVIGGTPPYNSALTKNNIDFIIDTNDVFAHLDTGLYYILTTDSNGCLIDDTAHIGASSSICTGITNIPQLQSFRIEPNPAKDLAMINYQLNAQVPITISLYDLTGKKITQIKDETETIGPHTHALNLSTLPAGEYILNLVSGEDSFNVKLEKQ